VSRGHSLALFVVAGAAVWWWSRNAPGTPDTPANDADPAVTYGDGTWLSDIINSTFGDTFMTSWSPDLIPAKYLQAFRSAETRNGIPTNLLARQGWQESRYRADAVSPVGAKGLMQFMPATADEFGINPLDPYQSIDAAGRYMAMLFRMTGSWASALAAYNWGIGNVQRKGLGAAPLETRNYYSQILADIGLPTTTA
jgi:soluble lytic murein transglycosylase-like protein